MYVKPSGRYLSTVISKAGERMKFSRFIAPVLILTIFLTGCSLLPLSADEKKYVVDCQIVYDNLEKYVKTQNKFTYSSDDNPVYDWRTWPETYHVTNAGQASRDSALNSIKNNFPWVYPIVTNFMKNKSEKEFISESPSWWSIGELEEAVYEGYFQMLASGSNFKVTVEGLKKIDNRFYDLELNNVFGSFAVSDRFKNCDEALDLKDGKSFESRESNYGLYGYKGVDLDQVLQVSIGIWGCETFGVGYEENYSKRWANCVKKDYVGNSDYTTTAPSVMTDEERAILEERARDAEREAQNPSGSSETSDARPLQGCNSLGQVVQTQSYGQLTCKIVLMNRIKALVWMRS